MSSKRRSSEEPREAIVEKRRRMEAEAYDSDDSELEPDDNDRRDFEAATSEEQQTASEVALNLFKATQKCPDYGPRILNCLLRKLAKHFKGLPRDVRVTLGGCWDVVEREVVVENEVIGHIWQRDLKLAIEENIRSDAPKAIDLDLHICEAPLKQPSNPKLTSWLIQGRLVEPKVSAGDPFPLVVFCGEGKPPLDVFLRQLCVEAGQLNRSVNAVLADANARSFIKDTVYCNAESGCQKCTAKGEVKSGTMSFGAVGDRRTHRDFINGVYDDDHRNKNPMTPLTEIPKFDVIEQVTVADNRHILHQGILLHYYEAFKKGLASNGIPWLETSCHQSIAKSVVPHERRAAIGRSLKEHNKEDVRVPAAYGYIMDVLGIVAFRRPAEHHAKLYQNYCFLHFAVAIYSHMRWEHYRKPANRLLRDFVKQHELLAGNVTSNVHNLLHHLDEVQRFGSLPLLSTYPFEDEAGVLGHQVDVTKNRSLVQQAATALLLRQRVRNKSAQAQKPPARIQFPVIIPNGVKVRKNFLLLNNDDSDSWFLVPGTGPLSRGQVVKFVSAKADSKAKVVVCGKLLTKQTTISDHPFANPIGLDVFATEDKKDLQSTKEYGMQDMICKLCVVWMPDSTNFVALPESFE